MSFSLVDPNLAICIATAIFCVATCCVALARDARSPVYRSFASGMALMAADTLLSYLAMSAATPEQALLWSKLSLNASALIPGSWLAFSLSYARSNSDEFGKAWKWPLLAAFVIPSGLASLGWNGLLGNFVEVSESGYWVMPLGLYGYGFYVVVLLCSVLILANLEKTLRASHGAIRWRIKFAILAATVIFAAKMYVCAQALMFFSFRSETFDFDCIILILANALFIVAGVRSELRDAAVYVSRDIFRGSFTTLLTGAGLIGVGLFEKGTSYFAVSRLALGGFLVAFSALLFALLLLLVGALRYKVLRFIHVNFLKSRYDYRTIWTDFTRRTTSLVDIDSVCQAIAETVSHALALPAVSIWLFEEILDGPALGASTAPLPENVEEVQNLAASLLGVMRCRRSILDLVSGPETPGISTRLLMNAGVGYCVSLTAGGEFLGMMTLGGRGGPPFSVEDLELVQTFADHAAELILNQKLFENLGQAREVEAFHAMSTFFIHDLKNVASTLSLTLSNFPLHYEDPDFRADTLKIMTGSVAKIRSMCGRLAALDGKFELHERECDLNELVSDVLSDLNLGAALATDLGPVPVTSLDPEQIRKVVLNLVLNACQSSGTGAQILVATSGEDAWLRLRVTDQGCGMSTEFINKSLFRPFRTTKKGGSGIGLYQSRMIVEAHGGRIEAQSREGRGSSFSVFLPLKGRSA